MEKAHDLSAGLLRQRRNLILTCSALIFLHYAQAEINSFQILGLSATFKRPEVIILGLKLMTMYFSYRYWLYFIQEPSFGIKFEFYRRLNQYANKKITKLRDDEYPDGKGLELYEDLGVRKSGIFTWSIMVGSEKDGVGGENTGYLSVSMSQVWWQSLKAGVLAIVARSFFTDYIFPLILAVFAIYVSL
ncbi:hypothetical protein [Teredinibacter purpureus]|uniref:hypothetical protein n=1 Tax=Teredinibacter purpureus TaxID=2731756 RepID=UPI0005F849EA|nr:hypothetical protein [Teredinibacter purpureus]